jgi:sulfite dehydrogenase (cytochrome) subunit B
MKTLLLLSAIGLAAATMFAGEVTITLPTETVMLKPGKGVELAQANCMTCHSADYLAMQPPMPKKFWEANVKKMIEKYAAPISPEATAGLVEYLAATYGAPDSPKP